MDALLEAAVGSNDVQGVMNLMMLQELRRMRGDAEGEGGPEGMPDSSKAYRRLDRLHENVYKNPKALIRDYLKETMDNLGAGPGESWQLGKWSERIAWGRMKGLFRVPYHLSFILTLSLRGRLAESQAYTVQLPKALYQVHLDQGSWDTAHHLLPKRDPVMKTEFGGTREELATIYAYQDALKKIKKFSEKTPGQNVDKDGKGKGGGKGDKGGGRGGGAAAPDAEGL